MKLSAAESDRGKRLDSFLHEKLPEFSRARLQAWIKDGRVARSGGVRIRASQILRGDEELTVTPAELTPLSAEAEELPLEILYEDADVVVVNKPPGMVVHAGAGHARGTLVNALLHHFGTLSSINGDLRPGIVHRLDRDTSGLLAVARTDRAHQALAKQFHDRQVEKVYLALAHGTFKHRSGRITAPIARDPQRRTRMTTKLASGRAALTDYQVLEQFERLAYLSVRIGTGRTHQIRVHLASIHHPVAGDALYGAPRLIPSLPPLERFFLHAHRLSFRSPSAGSLLTFESPLPSDLSRYLASLRAERG